MCISVCIAYIVYFQTQSMCVCVCVWYHISLSMTAAHYTANYVIQSNYYWTTILGAYWAHCRVPVANPHWFTSNKDGLSQHIMLAIDPDLDERYTFIAKTHAAYSVLIASICIVHRAHRVWMSACVWRRTLWHKPLVSAKLRFEVANTRVRSHYSIIELCARACGWCAWHCVRHAWCVFVRMVIHMHWIWLPEWTLSLFDMYIQRYVWHALTGDSIKVQFVQ